MESVSIILWRFLRGAIASGIAQIVVLQPDFSNPEQALKLIFATFVSGFLLALSKALRNSSISEKAPIIEKMPV